MIEPAASLLRRGRPSDPLALIFLPDRDRAGSRPNGSSDSESLRLSRWGLYPVCSEPSRWLMASSRDVTALLDDWSRGNRDALNQLLPLVYAELRRMAARQLRIERVGHTLQPTALVHEAYLRLVEQRQVDWQNRAHFFGAAALVMRRILVDHARRHGASKRGEGVRCVSIEEAKGTAAPSEMPILALDHALGRLEEVDSE